MSASDLHAVPDSFVGTTIGRYRLLRILGSGGMGTVYLAEHVRIGHQVAVKLLRPEVKDRREVGKRFLAEARAMGRVSHPGVVSIVDLDSLEDGTAYLIMEYLPGTSLRAHLREGKQPPSLKTTLRILHQAALAMVAAHAAGVIHRDLSPANIMLSPRAEHDADWPQIKILDFGLARVANQDGVSDSSLSTTKDGAVLGTLKYMAPEQCLDPHSVDEQADVYALGVIGYELIAGRPPFSAPSGWELISLHLREPPPPLPSSTPDGEPLPPELATLILDMLAKSPIGRPDMSEVAARLDELLPERPISTGSVSQPLLRSSRRRGRVLPIVIAALAVVTIVCIAVGLYARRQARLAEQRRRETLTAAGELLSVINRHLRPIPGAASASNAILDTADRLLDRLSLQSPSDLEVRESTVRLNTLRGEIARNHTGLPAARKSFERAIALSESLVAAQPDNLEYRSRLASSYDGLADVLEQLSELPLAKASYEKALNIRLEVLRKTPDDAARIQDAVASYLLRGDLSRTQGQQRLALSDYEQARNLLEPLWRREPDKKAYRWQMCGVLYRLGQTLLNVGKSAQAAQNAERAVELLLRIAPNDQQGASYHLLLARVLMMRGDVRDRLGQTLDAEHDYAQSLDITRGLLKASPSDVQLRRALIDSSYKAIDQWLRIGKVALAESAASQLESTSEQLLKSDPTNQGHKWRLAGSLQRIGDMAMQHGRFGEALKIYQRALEIQESLRAQSPDYSRHRDRTVWLWERQGDAAARGAFPEHALPIWMQALELLGELERVDSATVDVRLATARILRKRGVLRYKLDHKAEALGDWEQAAKLAEGLIALDAADGASQRELILIEFARSQALGPTIATHAGLPERLGAARERLAKLTAQALFLSDVELAAAERVLIGTPGPIK